MEYLQMAVQLGSFGVLAWVIKRLFEKTMPNMQTDFRLMLENQQKVFTTEMRLEREAHRQEHDKLVDAQRKDLEALRQEIRDALLVNTVERKSNG